MPKKFYITTAIDYVNAKPHIGHALEKIQADVLARYHRLLGKDVFFLTGTDENSLKNVQSAEKEGIPIKKLVDRNTKEFKKLKEILNLSFDDFIRTTEKRHIQGVHKLWQACQKDIYKKKYRGLYCIGCEMFYKESELENGLCPEHKEKPQIIEEENYFFRLSKYQKKLEKLISSGKLEVVPATRKNETLSFIRLGLEDFSISRFAERGKGWGIPVPGDKSQIIYVWFDALANYITALGYPDLSCYDFQRYWPADLHCIGKGILRFHAIYWPAILLSVGLKLPKKIFVHGYITIDGQKISKTLGNVIEPSEVVRKYGTDAVRYFLLREIPPTEDGDFTYEKLEARYNADLARGLGNLVARVLAMAGKVNPKSKIPMSNQIQNPNVKKEIDNTWEKYRVFLDNFKFNKALSAVWGLVGFCDRYIEKERPWEKSKSQASTIGNLLFAISHIAHMLQPFLPETAERIFEQLGISPSDKKPWKFRVKKGKPLFPRI